MIAGGAAAGLALVGGAVVVADKRGLFGGPPGEGIAVLPFKNLSGDPTQAFPYIRPIVKESGGTIVSVSETEIRAGRRMLEAFPYVPLAGRVRNGIAIFSCVTGIASAMSAASASAS